MRPGVLLRHFGVDDAAAGGHPLHAAAFQLADVAEMIFMPHVAVEHVGHGLEAPMRMRRKAGDVIVGVVGRKVIEHEKRVEPRPCGLAETAAELDSRAVGSRDGFDDALQCA